MADTLRHIEPDVIFQNTTTSYKFFWCFALLNLHQNTRKSLFECNDVISRMICEAYYVLDNNKITLGRADHFRSSMYSLKKLYPRGFDSADEMYNRVSKDISTKGIRKVISYYKENVPFRFLTPWAPQNSDGPYIFDKIPLGQESIMFPSGAPYIIYKELDQWLIKLNPLWIEYFDGKHDELKKTVINCLARYIAHRNEMSIEQYQDFLKGVVLQNKCANFCSIIFKEQTDVAKKERKLEQNPSTQHNSHERVNKSKLQVVAEVKEKPVLIEGSNATDNVIRAGKVVSINDPKLLSKVNHLIRTNRLDAIKFLIDHFDGNEDIKMSFRDWGELLEKIPADNNEEKEDEQKQVLRDTPVSMKEDKHVSVQSNDTTVSRDNNGLRRGIKSDWDVVNNAILGIESVHDIFGDQEDFPSFIISSLRLDGMAVSMSVKAWSYKTKKRYVIHLIFNEVTYYHASITTSQNQSFRIAYKKSKEGYKYKIGDSNIYINSSKARLLGITKI